MKTGDLGKPFQPGEIIFREGEPGDTMFVIQEGKVEVFLERKGQEVPLELLREGDFLGDSIFNSIGQVLHHVCNSPDLNIPLLRYFRRITRAKRLD